MTKEKINLAQLLTYLGTLPVLIALALKFYNPLEIDGIVISKFYAAIIVSFISGIHWGIYLLSTKEVKINLFITSNIIALIAWGSLIYQDVFSMIILQIICFLLLLYIDTKLYRKNFLQKWFYELRVNATLIISIALLLNIIL